MFVPATQLLIGAVLIAGAFVRLAALGGAIQMTLFYGLAVSFSETERGRRVSRR